MHNDKHNLGIDQENTSMSVMRKRSDKAPESKSNPCNFNPSRLNLYAGWYNIDVFKGSPSQCKSDFLARPR